jgi:hypothetical protein
MGIASGGLVLLPVVAAILSIASSRLGYVAMPVLN